MATHSSGPHQGPKNKVPNQADDLESKVAGTELPKFNALNDLNDVLLKQVHEKKRDVDQRSEARPSNPLSGYPLIRLKSHITEIVRKAFDNENLDVAISGALRSDFSADLVVRIPELLKTHGPKVYADVCVSKLKSAIDSDSTCLAAIEEVKSKGIYLNLLLKKEVCLESLSSVLELAELFGRSNVCCDERITLDYSSPNAAKSLHAGHIRSTIIGHVLGNIYESAGARVYRINHINDLGGFGYLLEGYRRWNDRFEAELAPSDKLIQIYAIRRACERVAESFNKSDEISQSDWQTAVRFLGPFSEREEFLEKYREYRESSEVSAQALENGNPKEVELWRQMIAWSLEDFSRFYDALGIHLDFTIGESFYLNLGNAVVDRAIAEGKALVWTDADAKVARDKLADPLAKGEITEAEYKTMIAGINRDLGAVVIPFADGDRLVVRRSDGRSIYATRDLGALAARKDIFAPTRGYYVVGQEQQDHFKKVFEAARQLGIISPELSLEHIYFGFYVDAQTKRKLSSREGASSVHYLLAQASKHFEKRYEQESSISDVERASIARTLAVGSLVFNDLKRDMKAAVDVEVGDVTRTLHDFEKSGGAYVVYSACRARSIIRAYNRALPPVESISAAQFNDSESQLALKLQELPERIVEAAISNKPSVLIRYLLETSAMFNTFYAKHPVLKDGVVHEHRLVLTAAVQQVLENGLKICHVDCPERI